MWEGVWAEFREREGGGELVNLLPNTFACNLIICNNIMDFYKKTQVIFTWVGPWPAPIGWLVGSTLLNNTPLLVKLVPFGYRPGISRIFVAFILNIKIPLIFIKFCSVKLLIIYFGFCRVNLRVTRVSGAVRALYSLPGDLCNKLLRMALGSQNS